MALVTLSFEEFSWVSLGHTIEMTLIGMSSWNGEVMFTVEFQLRFDDSKGLFRHFTLNGPVENIIRNLFDVVGKFGRGDDFFDFGEWGFVVRVVEDGTVFEGLVVGEVGSKNLFSGEGEILLSDGFIVAKRT